MARCGEELRQCRHMKVAFRAGSGVAFSIVSSSIDKGMLLRVRSAGERSVLKGLAWISSASSVLRQRRLQSVSSMPDDAGAGNSFRSSPNLFYGTTPPSSAIIML